jgi:hypothetical protein
MRRDKLRIDDVVALRAPENDRWRVRLEYPYFSATC